MNLKPSLLLALALLGTSATTQAQITYGGAPFHTQDLPAATVLPALDRASLGAGRRSHRPFQGGAMAVWRGARRRMVVRPGRCLDPRARPQGVAHGRGRPRRHMHVRPLQRVRRAQRRPTLFVRRPRRGRSGCLGPPQRESLGGLGDGCRAHGKVGCGIPAARAHRRHAHVGSRPSCPRVPFAERLAPRRRRRPGPLWQQRGMQHQRQLS